MQSIFRDPIWEFIGVVVGTIVALGIALITIWFTRHRKALAFRILSNTSIANLSPSRNVKGRVQILFDDEPVQNVKLLLMQLKNTGNVPITSSDFEKEIVISLNDQARILEAGITETNPVNLPASISVEGAKLVLHPILLNRHDSVTLKILADTFNERISVEGRIVGLRKIEELRRDASWYMWRIGCWIMGFGGFLFVVGTILMITPLGDETAFPFLMGSVVFVFIGAMIARGAVAY